MQETFEASDRCGPVAHAEKQSVSKVTCRMKEDPCCTENEITTL